MTDITEIFINYLEQFGSADMAEFEFKKAIHADSELRNLYRTWCDEVGSTEKNGFFDFSDEYLAEQNDVWQNLNNDYDE